MKNILKSFWLLLVIISHPLSADEFLPSTLLQLDPFFTHHILVAEKSTHQLHLFKNENGLPKKVKTFEVATGKRAGNKFLQGDHRTPEGIYRLTDFLTHQDLIKRHGVEMGAIYGVGAFVMDYPNPIDILAGKTGGGIWVHSTNDETRIDKGLDSRGCIVSTNKDLIELSQFIELQRSSVVVVQDLTYLKKDSWLKNRAEIEEVVEGWLTAWRNLDLPTYLSYYSPNPFYDPVRKNFEAFKAHKSAVFKQPTKPVIEARHLSVISSGTNNDDYLMVSFIQNYQSASLNDIGRKTLYMKRDAQFRWKIIAELWSKHGIPEETEHDQLAQFTPSMRFFESRDPAQILQVDFRQRNQTNLSENDE